MKIRSTLAIAAFSVVSAASSQAATLATFAFTGGSLANSATPIAGLTVSNVSTASSFNSFLTGSGFDSAAQISGASNFFAPTTQATAGNALSFTLTAGPGVTFSLDGFSFIARSTLAAPGDIGFRVGATAYDFSSTYSNNSVITTISNSALGVTGATARTITIQGWNSTGASALQLDNLSLTGTVVPESSSALLGALGALALLRRRR